MDESGGSGRPRSDGTDGRRPAAAEGAAAGSEAPEKADGAHGAADTDADSAAGTDGADDTARPREETIRQAPGEEQRPAAEP
ncbi:MAG: hypothetical protein WCD21_38790, partial [Streptomyces sp.]